MEVVWQGEGPLYCTYTSPAGQPCTKHEVDGLGFCFWHVPEEMLDEAEQVTGRRRCRHGSCRFVAVTGTEPPRCKNHGANAGSVISKQAASRVVEGRMIDRMAEIMGENGDRLLNPAPIGNPLDELLKLAAEMTAWKEIMRTVVVYLMSRERIRAAHDKVGEQLRAEVQLYERAMERLAKILQDIAKLGIEARLAKIEDTQVAMVDRALAAALNKATAGLPDALERQQSGRTVLQRELVKAAG